MPEEKFDILGGLKELCQKLDGLEIGYLRHLHEVGQLSDDALNDAIKKLTDPALDAARLAACEEELEDLPPEKQHELVRRYIERLPVALEDFIRATRRRQDG